MNKPMNHRALGYLAMALPLAATGILTIAENTPVFAQLTPDNTLGAENSIVTPQQLRDLIQGGAIRGNALFHSFEEFNVGDGGSVFFDLQNNTDILNIFTRITGSSSSNILGTLGVLNDALNSDALGNANLFLLNPNGITFGANANLQLNGSFFATTADSFDFDDFSFSASGQEAPPPLLTVNIPRFASFRDNPGDIAVNQGSLTVNPGQNLSLVGGNVTVTGSGDINNPILNVGAPDGRIEIGSAASGGSVSLTQTDAGLMLGYEGIETFGDITFNQVAYVDTSGENGGSIQLQGRDITLSENSGIVAFTVGAGTGGGIVVNSEQLIIEGRSFVNAVVVGSGQGGDLSITASNLLIQGGSQIAIATSGEGDGGDFTITTSNLLIQDGAQIIVATSGEGDGGDLTVNVTDSIQVLGISPDLGIRSALVTSNFPGSTGNAGDLTINTSQLLVQDGAAVSTSTFGEGKGGILTVNATDSIEVIGTSPGDQFASNLFAGAGSGFTGNSGDLIINTSNLLIQDGAFVSVSTLGEGDGGNLTVNVTDSIQLIGRSTDGSFASDLVARANPGSTGNGGNLTINTSRLLIQDGAQVSVDTLGEGNGGNLTVNATDSVQVIGSDEFGTSSSLSAGAIQDATGNAGNLTINTPQLLVQDRGLIFASTSGEGNAGDLTINTSQLLVQGQARVSVSTFGEGNGGNLTVNATDSVQLTGTSADDDQSPSGLFSQANQNATGDAGDLTINTSQLLVQDRAQVSARAFADGNGGNLTILSDNLTVDNGSITAQTANADGGNITLNIADLLLLRNGNGNTLISATAGGEGNGGNLNIDTTFLVAFPNENSDISANARQGNGGNINITANGVLGIQFRDTLTDFSDITASSDFGISGTVTLNTPQTQINQEQIEQPEEVVDSSDVVSQSVCSDFGGNNQLANTGRGGVPQIPGFITRNDVVNVDLVDEVLPAPPAEAIKPHHRTTVTFLDSEGEEFKPAMGAVLLPNGMVEFVDYSPAEVYRDMYAASCLGNK